MLASDQARASPAHLVIPNRSLPSWTSHATDAEHGHADESADYILAALRGEEVEELDLDAFAELMQVHQRGDLSMHALKQVTRRVAELLAERGTADAAAPSAADDDGWTVKGSGGRAAAQQPTNGSSTTKSNGGHHSRNGSSGSGRGVVGEAS